MISDDITLLTDINGTVRVFQNQKIIQELGRKGFMLFGHNLETIMACIHFMHEENLPYDFTVAHVKALRERKAANA